MATFKNNAIIDSEQFIQIPVWFINRALFVQPYQAKLKRTTLFAFNPQTLLKLAKVKVSKSKNKVESYEADDNDYNDNNAADADEVRRMRNGHSVNVDHGVMANRSKITNSIGHEKQIRNAMVFHEAVEKERGKTTIDLRHTFSH